MQPPYDHPWPSVGRSVITSLVTLPSSTCFIKRLTDEEEDSGADSMNDVMSNHSCRLETCTMLHGKIEKDRKRIGKRTSKDSSKNDHILFLSVTFPFAIPSISYPFAVFSSEQVLQQIEK